MISYLMKFDECLFSSQMTLVWIALALAVSALLIGVNALIGISPEGMTRGWKQFRERHKNSRAQANRDQNKTAPWLIAQSFQVVILALGVPCVAIMDTC